MTSEFPDATESFKSSTLQLPQNVTIIQSPLKVKDFSYLHEAIITQPKYNHWGCLIILPTAQQTAS